MNDTVVEPIMWLENVKAVDAASAGDKAVNLAALLGAGLPVLPGFVVTADAFRSAARDAGIAAELAAPIDRNANIPALSLRLQDSVHAAGLPAGVATVIDAAYRALTERLSETQPVVVVRPSAVAEDASFVWTAPALTGIRGVERLRQAVVACWAALFNEQAMRCRAALRSPSVPAMAVVIQPMVHIVRSGETFTVDPVHHRDDVVIVDARFGAADEEATGAPSWDTYVVTRATNEVAESRIGVKPWSLAPEPTETASEPGAAVRRRARVLTDGEASRLAALALEAERSYHHPQRVDWCIDADGEVWLLESRPIHRIDDR